MPIKFDSRALPSRPMRPTSPAFQRAKVRRGTSRITAAWSSVTPPNAVGEQLAAAFAETIASLSTLRGGLAFEQEPASFLAALQETKEIAG